jgi:hypothetical protein
MPFQKRLDILPAFTQYLPQMLTALSLDDPSFVMLISAFPSAAMQWYTDLSPTGSQKLMAALRGGQTPTDRVFAAMADSAAKLKLESTKISVSRHDRQITAVYLQDEASNPVKLTLKFPPRYPFCQVNVVCEFGSEGQRCEYEVVGAIIKSQSVEGGIIRWHQFVTQRLVDGEPCPVCYSYISEDMKKPTITCPTCGQKFHGKCLSKWFSNCLKPTCPYCATAWEQKKRPPSH